MLLKNACGNTRHLFRWLLASIGGFVGAIVSDDGTDDGEDDDKETRCMLGLFMTLRSLYDLTPHLDSFTEKQQQPAWFVRIATIARRQRRQSFGEAYNPHPHQHQHPHPLAQQRAQLVIGTAWGAPSIADVLGRPFIL